MVVLDDISIKVDVEKISKEFGKRKMEYIDKINEFAKEAELIAKPKGVIKESYIQSKGEDFIVVEGQKFTSKVLRTNVDKIHRIFPFIATCGKEIEEWSHKFDDILDIYIVDKIMDLICRQIGKEVNDYVNENYNLKNISQMNPGSISDWSITEQEKLFKVLGDGSKIIDVELTSSCLMKPAKTVSGIMFSSEVKYYNCELCPKQNCPDRKARYNKELYSDRYGVNK